jgi:iron complex outermembrane receptor protein
MRKLQGLAGVASAAMMVAAGQAMAQEATALDEIVVTAQKRAENLQDVPVSVTAFTADQLKDQRVGDVLALSGLSPGLQIKTDDNAANPRIFIRGIGVNDFNPATASAIGVYVDGVYVASPLAQMAGFYDLQQVEVLRGPQGTLYGRNTTGGAINVTTKKPSSTPEGDLAVDYGRFNSLNVQGGFGGPIGQGDVLAFRISGLYDKSDGYTLNRLTGNKGNDADRKAVRGALRFKPDDKLTVDVSASYSKSNGGSILGYNRSLVAQTADAASTATPDPTYGFIFCKPSYYTSGQCTNVGGYANTSSDKYAGDYRFEGKDLVKLFGATTSISYDFGGATLYSVTGYQRAKRDDLEETDANPISLFGARYIAEQDTTSQEFRLQSNGQTALRWVAGVYGARDNLDNDSHYDVLDALRDPTPDNPTGMDPANSIGVFGWPLHQKTTSYAAFGQVDYDLTPKLTLTGGLRWSQDKKTFHYVSDVDYGLLTLFDYDDAKTFSSISGRLGLRYAISDDANVYATYNRGTKSGGFFSGQTTDPRDLGPYKDETVNAYEMGSKSEFFDRRLRVNLSAFYYDYKDLQVYTVVQRDGLPVQLFTNASKARVYGGEAEVEARPMTGLSLTLGASLLSAEYKDFSSLDGDYSGNTLPSAPKTSLNGAARYEHPLGVGNLITQLDFTYRSKVYYDTANTERLSDKARAFVNGQVGWAFADGRYELGVWGKNLADTTNISDITPVTAFGFDVFSMGPPRTYGLYFRAKY